MKIALISEMGYDGKIPESKNARRVWELLSDGLPLYFFNYMKLLGMPRLTKSFDAIIYIVPKSNPGMCQLIQKTMRTNKDINHIILQEGPWWGFQEWSIKEQALYLKTVKMADAFFSMSDDAEKYYKNLAKKVSRVVFPVDIERARKYNQPERQKMILIGGNSVPWYNGTTSILSSIGKGRTIMMPTMGRNKGVMESIDWEYEYPENKFQQVPYLDHDNWLRVIGSVELVVHMFPQCAGERLPMEAAAVGTPCIGNIQNSIQMSIFPRLGAEVWDLTRSSEQVSLILSDKKYRDEIMDFAEKSVLRYRPVKVCEDWKNNIRKVLDY